jgi:hypothetical protein
MTATSVTTSPGTRPGQRVIHVVRRMALGAGSLATGIGSRWNAFVESGQLGPSAEHSISRHTGSRI